MNLDDFSQDWKPETVNRNEGITPEEQYLQRLCDRSFLSLWSFASPSRDQKADAKGDGKELCDLLVVCGDDILVFSDKGCKFPNTWRHKARLVALVQARYSEVGRAGMGRRSLAQGAPG